MTDAVDVVVALKSRVEVLEAALDAARRMRESRPVEAALNARLEELRRLPDTAPEVVAGEVAVRAVGTPDDGGPVPLPGLTVSVLIGDQEVARGYTDASGVARVELPEHPERARGYEVRLLGPDDEQLTRARGSSLEGGAHVMEAAPTAALKRSFRAGLGYRKGLAAAEAEAKAIAESSALELEARAARLEKSIEIVRGGIVRVLGGE
ncbi:MAG: hypothetical protein H6730_12715 [Deltaproteobacteria bacterium]|nr:hypothetical protein [Deltaproteobacteria bacterium]